MQTSGELEEWVLYRAPKSVSFGHQSKPREARRCWPVIQRFLAELTTQSSLGDRIILGCEGGSGGTQTDFAHMPRADEARLQFGPETSEPRYFPQWKLDPSQLEVAIQFALDDDKFPKQKIGPTTLYFSYSFSWVEFQGHLRNAEKEDARTRASSLGIHVGGGGIFLQPHFIFPAPWTSEALKAFVARIEPLMPFRLRDQYFQRMMPIKGSGKRWGKTLKLDKQWRRQALS